MRAQAANVAQARALKERQRDPAVEIGEQPSDRPEPLQLGAQLVCQRRAHPDQILPRAGQRPQRLGLITVRLKHPEAMMIGTRQLAQHERARQLPPAAKPSRAAAAGGCTPPAPIRRHQALRRSTPPSRPAAAQRPQPRLVMRERRGQQPLRLSAAKPPPAPRAGVRSSNPSLWSGTIRQRPAKRSVRRPNRPSPGALLCRCGPLRREGRPARPSPGSKRTLSPGSAPAWPGWASQRLALALGSGRQHK